MIPNLTSLTNHAYCQVGESIGANPATKSTTTKVGLLSKP
jgi:hypothetical protein